MLCLSSSSPIDLDGTFFLQIAIFFAAFAVLYALVFRPVVRLFEMREASTVGRKEEARRLREETRQQEAAFEADLEQLRNQAGSERDRLRQEGVELERTLLEKVRQDTQRLLSNADSQVKTQARQVRDDLQKEVPRLARQIAGKLLGREVN